MTLGAGVAKRREHRSAIWRTTRTAPLLMTPTPAPPSRSLRPGSREVAMPSPVGRWSWMLMWRKPRRGSRASFRVTAGG
jgi:hypothetical protein